jgi:hypothetical protein
MTLTYPIRSAVTLRIQKAYGNPISIRELAERCSGSASATSWRVPFLAVVVVIVLIAAGVYLALTNVRFAIAAALILAALDLLLSNLAGYLRHR